MSKGKDILTGGNIIVNNIKVGDKHFEFQYGYGIRLEVLTLPKKKGKGWAWSSKNLRTGATIEYFVNPAFAPSAPKLYDYEAQKVNTWI